MQIDEDKNIENIYKESLEKIEEIYRLIKEPTQKE